MKQAKYILALTVCVLVVVLDLVTKRWVAEALPYGQPHYVTSFFNLYYIHNPGAAFGFLASSDESFRAPFFLTTSIVAFVVIAWLLHKSPAERRLHLLGLALVLGGAIGNFVDRIRFGYVIDFLDFHWGAAHWPAFNVADMAISVGVGCLLLDSLLETRREKAMQKKQTA